ncbi:type 1 glutamine amidotransferase domain-containing protein [Lacticaseibacillus sp. GG6-2]
MSRALIVVTNHAHFDGTDRATGVWFSEVAHFHDVMNQNGVTVDYVSPEGGFVPLDPASLAEAQLDALSWQYYGDASYRQKYLAKSFTPIQVDPTVYDLIYFAGGHGAMWDFPNNQSLGNIANAIAQQGGIVAAVGQGIVGLLAMGDYVQGKRLTGDLYEEEPLKGAGAQFVPDEQVVVSGRLITGQDAQSAHQIGIEAVKLLQDV